jgi:diguanylate cyclase (GGDEF)-like protein/PAS domain S-box-containing protein
MDDHDLGDLAHWLASQGIALRLTDARGALVLANGPGRALPAPGQAPDRPDAATLTLPLADGRILQMRGPRPEASAAASAARAPDEGQARYQLLAEHASDLIVALDRDLCILHATGAARPMLGWPADALVGRTLAELLVPEERAAFITRHFTASARRGGGPDLFRALRRDGGTLWVEARVAELPPDRGLGQYVVTLRDADRRRLAEQALAAANQELSTLAATDDLTGLPNRRQFDNALQKEWFRALRDGVPLALLMIDVDHFKRLNDLHGHPTGDAVLAEVARIIRDNVRRAGDMAARYGGEEFAVVLPGTSTGGAMDIGEAIRHAMHRADFSATLGPGAGITVSVGAAAMVPMAGAGAATLIHAADNALYQAKRNGRDRVELMN